jgi:2-phosphoglycerate kinase
LAEKLKTEIYFNEKNVTLPFIKSIIARYMETLIVYPTKAQEKAVKTFLKALNVQFEKKQEILPPHVLAGIKKGQEDIRAGDTFTYDEFKQQLSISK